MSKLSETADHILCSTAWKEIGLMECRDSMDFKSGALMLTLWSYVGTLQYRIIC